MCGAIPARLSCYHRCYTAAKFEDTNYLVTNKEQNKNSNYGVRYVKTLCLCYIATAAVSNENCSNGNCSFLSLASGTSRTTW